MQVKRVYSQESEKTSPILLFIKDISECDRVRYTDPKRGSFPREGDQLMMLALVNEAAPVPPPAYHRAQTRLGPALHIDALTLVNTLHLLTLCRLAVSLAHRRCPPPLPAGPGGAPCTYRDESLLLIALLRTLWRLSYRDMRDWLRDWPALALACGLPLGKEAIRAFLVPPNNASVEIVLGHRCQKRYLSSPF